MSNWVCYMIISLNSKETYIGSSNNQYKRLAAHNNSNNKIKRVGAKRTMGRTWIPLIIISGFESKIACLSFEAGWKRLVKYRSNKKLIFLDLISDIVIKYTKCSIFNRIIDLLWFCNNYTYVNEKFKINYNINCPVVQPPNLLINYFYDNQLEILPWPHFIKINKVTLDNLVVY